MGSLQDVCRLGAFKKHSPNASTTVTDTESVGAKTCQCNHKLSLLSQARAVTHGNLKVDNDSALAYVNVASI